MPIDVQHVRPNAEQQEIIRRAFPKLNTANAETVELRQRRKSNQEPLDDTGLEDEGEDDYGEPSDYEDEDGPQLDEPSSLDELSPGAAALLATVLWLFPLVTLFIGLDWAVHQQYRQDYPLSKIVSRLLNMLPGLIIFVYLSLRYPRSRITQAALFLYSAIGGSYMIYLANTASYFVVILRCPILGVLWIHSIIQMNLLPAVVSLAVVGAVVWTAGWSVISSPPPSR